jgi:hypothetical protein
MIIFYLEVTIVTKSYEVLAGSLEKERVPLTSKTLCTLRSFLKVLQSISRDIKRDVGSPDVTENLGASA